MTRADRRPAGGPGQGEGAPDPHAELREARAEVERLSGLSDRARVEMAHVETVERLRRQGGTLMGEIDAALKGDSP